MSSSAEFGLEVPEINDRSTISECIGFLLSSFREKEFKLVERILISREEEWKKQLKKVKDEHRLVEKIHGESELEKLEIQEELKRLKGEKLGEAETEKLEMSEVKKLRREVLALQQDMKMLKSERLEMLDELKKIQREKQEAEETAQLYGQKFPEYEERIAYLEKVVAGLLGTDASEIGTHCACNLSESDLQKEGCNNGTSEVRKDLLNGYSSAQIPIEDVAPKVEINGLTQEKEDDNLYAAASLSHNRICDMAFHDKKQLVLANSTQVFPLSVPISDRPRSPIVVEITDSDGEAPGDEKPFVSNTCISEVNSSKKGVTFMELGKSGCPSQTEDENKSNVMSSPLLPFRKRRQTESDDSDSSPVGKRKSKTVMGLLCDGKDSIVSSCSVKLDSAVTGSQPILPSAQGHMVNKTCEEKAGADCSLQTTSIKFDFDSTDDSSDYSSTDSEDDCSHSYINNLIASLRRDSRKSQKTWHVAADMLAELKKDNELCMNAVCALYRKKISAEKSINYTSSPVKLGFCHFDAMSGKDLAEFLTDGDPQHKLKRTVSEVQQKDSRLLERCKDLAIRYYETLFEIYRKKEDPFFHPRS